jgi:hypothetical protein
LVALANADRKCEGMGNADSLQVRPRLTASSKLMFSASSSQSRPGGPGGVGAILHTRFAFALAINTHRPIRSTHMFSDWTSCSHDRLTCILAKTPRQPPQFLNPSNFIAGSNPTKISTCGFTCSSDADSTLLSCQAPHTICSVSR